MKIRFIKLKDWLLMSVMGMFGLTSCHCHKQVAQEPVAGDEPDSIEQPAPRGEMALMYGVPTMGYRIMGQVKDRKGRPVEGVSVNLLEHGVEATADTIYGDQENIKKYLENNEVKTDKRGNFELRHDGLPREKVRVLVRDTDGKANGRYKNRLLDVPVKAENIDKTNAGGWNQGTFSTKIDIELESK